MFYSDVQQIASHFRGLLSNAEGGELVKIYVNESAIGAPSSDEDWCDATNEILARHRVLFRDYYRLKLAHVSATETKTVAWFARISTSIPPTL